VKSPTELTELFRQQGLKVTPQRQCIFRILHGSEVHPTAEAVYAAAVAEMPTMSLRTVYQTLNDLAAMGEIQQLDLGTGSSRFDPNTDGHHHLVCTACGKVRDLYADFTNVRVPSGAHGFHVSTTEIVFRGLCDDCAPVSH
jgi:Fe2+ or Zn2+ uptake regulation protein